MNRELIKRIATLMTAISAMALTGCGATDPAAISSTPGAIITNPGVVGTCIPITSQIGFSGTNVHFDSANIWGGMIPGSQTIGQMMVGGASAGGAYQRTGSDGTISMNIVPANTAQTTYTPYYPNNQSGTMANLTGIIQISALAQQDIVNQAMYGNLRSLLSLSGTAAQGYYQNGVYYQNTAQAQQICVSGIALNVGHYNNTVYGGYVFLYLNNTQHGYALKF